LLLLIILGNVLRQPKPVKKSEMITPKRVIIYRIGTAPRVHLQAQIEKSGVIQMNSLTAGVVQTIYHQPGDFVHKGDLLIGLSTNYQGGNIPALNRQLAQKQYQNTNETFPISKDLIAKQRSLANTQNTNASDLRNITNQSISETSSLIALNNDIITTLDQNLATLNSLNVGGTNNATILATKELKSQFQSANNQLNGSLRTSQYNASNTNASAQLADLQRDIALKQLDIQEKALDLNREVSRLQLQITQVNEGIMFPTAPFDAVVQRVFVKVGQAVQPGTSLLILAQPAEADPIVAMTYAPREIAQNVSMLEPSTIHFGAFTYDAFPSFITTDAIQGTLYGIYFPIPDNYSRFTTEKGYIDVEVPIGYYNTSSTMPFIPLDAVYQSQSASYVFVVVKGKAVSRVVVLGPVFGRFVNVQSGLSAGDEVIVTRTVIDGDQVTFH